MAAETLEAERGQALQSLLTHRQRQNDLALSMDDSIRRNSSILLGLSQEDTDPNQSRIEVPVGGSSSLEEIKVKLGSLGREDEMSDSFDSWLASFKSSRPAAGLHSPPATPSTPPRFDDSPSRSPARQSASLDRIELSHGHTQLSSVLNVATSPARSAAPMRHQGSPGMDGDPPSTSRPPPHPRGRQVGKGVLSRNRFLNV